MEPIEAFGWVEPWLARGAQPEGEQYRWLAEQGIGIIVNVRMKEEERAIERAAPQLLGIAIPVKDHRAPTEDQALKWLRFCAAIEHRAKLYVHCRQGHGRTSLFCTLVRLAQGVPLNSALQEEQVYGFDPDKERAQMDFLTDFECRLSLRQLSIPKLQKSE